MVFVFIEDPVKQIKNSIGIPTVVFHSIISCKFIQCGAKGTLHPCLPAGRFLFFTQQLRCCLCNAQFIISNLINLYCHGIKKLNSGQNPERSESSTGRFEGNRRSSMLMSLVTKKISFYSFLIFIIAVSTCCFFSLYPPAAW
jgi:hypothetical protein